MTANHSALVLGGGFGGLHAAFSLRHALPDMDITLVATSPDFFYRPDSIYIPFGLDPNVLSTPVQQPLQDRRIRFVHGHATGLVLSDRTVDVGNLRLGYDYLVVATGAVSAERVFPGLTEHGKDITSVWQLLSLQRELLRVVSEAEKGNQSKVLFLLPPGNHFPGPLYEVALMLDTWLRRQDLRDRVDIGVVTWEKALFEALGPTVGEALMTAFATQGIVLHTQRTLTRVTDSVVAVEGETFPYDVLVVSPARVGALTLEGLGYDDHGLILTDTATRQAVGCPHVYVVGDAAADQRVKQAYLAFGQAEVAVHHIVCAETGATPTRFYDPRTRYIFDTLSDGILVEGELDGRGATATRSRLWRTSKQLLGRYLSWKVRHGQPFADLMDRKAFGNTLRAAALSHALDRQD